MGAWAIVVNILFPIPLVFLLILCLPLPNFARKWATKVMDLCLFSVILGKLSVYQVATFLSTILFALSSFETASSLTKSKADLEFFAKERITCQRWRNERNFWISFMSLVLWLILYRVHWMTKIVASYKDEHKSS
eukprot:gene27076-35789_t